MKRQRQISAAQMAMLSALGGLIVVCGFLVFFPHYEHGSSLWRVQLGTFIALIIVGFIISLKAASALEEGIADCRGRRKTSKLSALSSSRQCSKPSFGLA
ncbi:MAG: hypothetical protein ABI147_14265 [Acidobacteriaceae bacterium]